MIINATSLPTRDRRFHVESTVVTGNSIVYTQGSGSAAFGGYWSQSTAAQNDKFTTSFFVRAGTYTFSVLGRTNSNSGKVDWYLNNSIVVSAQDWYSVSSTENVIKTATITIPNDGYQIISGIVSTAGTGGGFNMYLTMLWLKQTSD
jgi:hypothetical protein